MTAMTTTDTASTAAAVVPGAELDILLAEYKALKDEQQKVRIMAALASIISPSFHRACAASAKLAIAAAYVPMRRC